MDFFNHFVMSMQVALQPANLFFCFLGVFIGNLIGVLPGLGPAATMSLLLPVTYQMRPVPAIIMLAGIYYGANYGGSITSILLNIPGEASSVVTCLDGYQMAKKGRAGAALGISTIGSFIGGTFGVVLTMLLAPPLAAWALKFGPPENACLIVFGLTMVAYLSSASALRALMMASVGMLLGTIGTDLITGTIRFMMGLPELSEGIGIIPVVMGLFGITEVILNIEDVSIRERQFFKTKFMDLFPNRQEFKDSVGPIARGSVGGFFLGILPGGGALLASFLSYATEKRISKHPERFGTGYIPGVAGPETANNSGAQGAYIPLLTLGIPSNTLMAVLMGAFMIHGIIPGPLIIKSHPDLFWGVIGSMYIGNVMLLALNLPLIGVWASLLRIRYSLLMPAILVLCLIGAYSINNRILDVYIMIIFGIVGYLMKKFGFPTPPLILALVLGPRLENYMGQSLMMSDKGSFVIFISSPISFTLCILTATLTLTPLLLKLIRKKRPKVLKVLEED